MIRSLYSAATGMNAQQLNIDVIANNLANVNTTGYKRSRADFQDLLYQTLKPAGTVVAAGLEIPTGIQLGHGVRPAAVQKIFIQGVFCKKMGHLEYKSRILSLLHPGINTQKQIRGYLNITGKVCLNQIQRSLSGRRYFFDYTVIYFFK